MIAVDPGRHRFFRHDALDRHALGVTRTAPCDLDHGVDGLTQVLLHALRLARPADLQHRRDQIVEPLDLVEDDAEQLAFFGVEVRRLAHQLHRAGDRAERVADLVRQACRQPAEHCEALLACGDTRVEPPSVSARE